MSLTKWFARTFNWSAPQRPKPQGFNTFILEPILTPSGIVDGPGDDTPDLDLVGDSDIPDLGDSPPDDVGISDPFPDNDFDDVPFLTDDPLTPKFDKGVFTVGDSGKVSIDFLYDGGGYKGQLAIFSLEGMEDLDTEDFIAEAARRAASNSTEGYIVIDDASEGAKFSGRTAWEGDFNSGDYKQVKPFDMNPGDTFGVMLIPNGTVEQVANNPSIGGSIRPLFSLETANPNDAFHVGQIADVTGDGNTFVMEDLRVDGWTDKDYNDIIFQVRGATAEAVDLDEVIDADRDWRPSDMGQALIEYAKAYVNDAETETELLLSNTVEVDQPFTTAIDTESLSYTEDTDWIESLIDAVDTAKESEQTNAVIHLDVELTETTSEGIIIPRHELTAEEINALEYARDNNVVLVVPAGDEGQELSAIAQAAEQFDNIITVGAAEQTDPNLEPFKGFERAEYSNFGTGLDLVAEGGTPESPIVIDGTEETETAYGTSVASSKVTKAISHVWAVNPQLSYTQVIDILKTTATDLETPNWDRETGAGLLNLMAAIHLAKVTKPGEEFSDSVAIEPPKPSSLFKPLNPSKIPESVGKKEENVLRQKFVDLDLGLLEKTQESQGQTITLNLFDDVSVDVKLDPVEFSSDGGNLVRVGKIPGVEYSEVILVKSKDSDVAVGKIRVDDKLYEIRFVSDGVHVVREVDLFAINEEVDNNKESSTPNFGTPPAQADGDAGYICSCGVFVGTPATAKDVLESSAYSLTEQGASIFKASDEVTTNLPDFPQYDGLSMKPLTASDTIYSAADGTNSSVSSSISVGVASGDTIVAGDSDVDNGSIIDVMVAYTPEARQAKGGIAAIKALIAQTEAETNQGYKNSGINQRIRIVHTAEVSYTESQDSSKDLDRLTNKNDGYLDEVHTLRDKYSADMVSLWTNKLSPGNAGLAWLGKGSYSFEKSAFSVVKTNQALWNLTFSHELGHNQGAGHDLGNGNGAYNYSHGYVAPDKSFRTIMAYNPGGVPRRNYWSNPDGTYENTGKITGIAGQADNRLTLNNTAQYAANWRHSNDNLATAKSITGSSVSVTGLNVNATEETSESNHAGNSGGKSVWWSWTAPSSGSVTVSTAGSNFDTLLGVYTGSSVASLATIASNNNDPSGGTASKVAFNAVAGQTYKIAVDGHNKATGKIKLNLTQNQPVAKPTVTLSTNDSFVGEPSNSGSFRISRTGSTAQDLWVNYSVAGNASNGKDYSNLSGWLKIPAGASSALIPINVIDDTLYEGNETVTINLAANNNYSLSNSTSDRTRTITITDNDSPPKSTISLSASDRYAYERELGQSPNGGLFKVTRSGGNNNKDEYVYYSISGNASNGSDYNTLSGYVKIPAGSTTAYIPVNVKNDSAFEGTEKVTLSLKTNSNYNINNSVKSDFVYIFDNDYKPTISISNYDSYANESGNSGSVRVTRSGGNINSSQRVYYNLSGTAGNASDYSYLPGYVDIPAGSTTAYIPIKPINDSRYEGTEQVRVNLQSNSMYNNGSSTSGYVNIYDNDPRPKSTISISNYDTIASESGNHGSVRVTRSGGDNSRAETVYYRLSGSATNGSDYSRLTGSITIPAGSSTAYIPVRPINDSTYEGTEQMRVTLQSSWTYNNGSSTSGYVNIYDNDPRPTSTINLYSNDTAAYERNPGQTPNNGQFYVYRSGGDNTRAETVYYNIGGSATNGSDYSRLSGYVTIPAGSSFAYIPVNPINDYRYEGTENVTLSLRNVGGYKLGSNTSRTVNIYDNDPRPTSTINLYSNDTAAYERNPGQTPNNGQFYVYRSGGDSTRAETVYYNIGGSATNGSDYSRLSGYVTIPAGSSFAYIPVNPINDYRYEGTENVTLSLRNVGGYKLGSNTSRTVNIYDNDPQSTTLYNITFNEYAQRIGQKPLTGSSSSTVSSVVFGDPLVQQSLGNLNNRPLVFTDNQSGYDQIQLGVGKNYDRYSLSFDLDAQYLNNTPFTVLLDTPRVNNIYFNPDGTVRLFGGTQGTVGSYNLNGVNRVKTDVDFTTKNWKLIVNGQTLYNGTFSPSSDDLRSVRFSLGALNGITQSVVGIDNIKLTGS